MKNIAIYAMLVAILALVGRACCQDTRRRQQYPRPSRPSPGGRRFGEEHGWQYQRGGNYWYHPQSVWRWQPSNGWMDNSNRRYYRR